MQTIEELLKQAQDLSDEDLQRLKQQLEEVVAQRTRPASGPSADDLDWWGAQAGIADSDSDDVSTEKYKHLGEIYADER